VSKRRASSATKRTAAGVRISSKPVENGPRNSMRLGWRTALRADKDGWEGEEAIQRYSDIFPGQVDMMRATFTPRCEQLAQFNLTRTHGLIRFLCVVWVYLSQVYSCVRSRCWARWMATIPEPRRRWLNCRCGSRR